MHATKRHGLSLPSELPLIRGAGWWIYLTVWTALIAIAAWGAALYVLESTPDPQGDILYGFQMRENTGRATIQFPLGREAVAAAIKPGDRIVAIDGQPVIGDETAVGALLDKLGNPSAIAVTTTSGGVHRLTRSPHHVEQGFGASGLSGAERRAIRKVIFESTLFILPVALAGLLLARRMRDRLAPWASLMMVLSALGSGPALYTSAGTGDGVLGWAVWLACPLAAWAQIAILALFPEGRFRPWPTWLVVLGTLPLMRWMQVDSSVVAFNSSLLAGALAAVAVVWSRYRALPVGPARQQIRWALLGFAASLIAQLLVIVLQKIFFQTPSPVAYAWLNLAADLVAGLASVLWLVALTIGLLRYRLYDADAAISRSVAYGVLTVALLAVFAGSEKIIEVLGEHYFGEELGALASGLGAAVAAVLVGPFHHRVMEWTEHHFRSGLARLRHGLPLLVGDMRETALPQALADAMLVRVETGVRARHGAVVVGDAILDTRDIETTAVAGWLAETKLGDGLKLECDRDDPLFPMRVPLNADGVGLVGWLLLGPRPDGSFYGREEREALRDIADAVARALAIALARERHEAARLEREHNLAARLDALRRLVYERLGIDGPEVVAAPAAIPPKRRRPAIRRGSA